MALLLDCNGRWSTILSSLQWNKNFQNGLWPVTAVWKQSQIWKGFLWSPCFPLKLWKLIACKDKKWLKISSFKQVWALKKNQTPTFLSCQELFKWFNHSHPNISMHILCNILYTFHQVITRRIFSTINCFFNWWSFP